VGGHFIKAPYQVEPRLALYRLHLGLQDYEVAQTNTSLRICAEAELLANLS